MDEIGGLGSNVKKVVESTIQAHSKKYYNTEHIIRLRRLQRADFIRFNRQQSLIKLIDVTRQIGAGAVLGLRILKIIPNPTKKKHLIHDILRKLVSKMKLRANFNLFNNIFVNIATE